MSKSLNRDKDLHNLRRHGDTGGEPPPATSQPAPDDSPSPDAEPGATQDATPDQRAKALEQTNERLNQVSAGLETFGEQLTQLAVMLRAGVSANRRFAHSYRRYAIIVSVLTLLIVTAAATVMYGTWRHMVGAERPRTQTPVGSLEAAATPVLSPDLVAQMVGPLRGSGRPGGTSEILTFLPSTRQVALTRRAPAASDMPDILIFPEPRRPGQGLRDAARVLQLIDSALQDAAQTDAASHVHAD